MKDIKDYLHLYLGCPCEFKVSGQSETYAEYGMVIGMPTKGTEWIVRVPEEDIHVYAFAPEIKLLLRPLSDMSKEEEYFNNELSTMHSADRIAQRQREAERTAWLLKRRFDLFGLIERGLAIDKTTLK